ncbi:MAG: GNAT family N-acetyltransferase [Lachnospiraceae bacterium]|nr:GNAT family N-acetyltransferase [Lachnospiraceae bacterium]
MKLKNILLVVRDIEKSKAFYKDLFGLDVVTDFGGNIILTEGLVLQDGTIWERFIDRNVVSGGNDAELYFEENDMDGFLKKLETSHYDIDYVNQPMEHDWGQRVIRIYDPDKHIIEIGESMEYIVRKFRNMGMSPEQVAEKTQLPLSYVQEICKGDDLVFTSATEEDQEEILSLYRSAIGTEGCTWSIEYPNEDILKDDIEHQRIFCMKNQSGEIVGIISIDVDEEVGKLACWTEGLKPAAELARLGVKRQYQNMGIAKLLLKGAMRELVRRGYKGVHFLVSKTNERAIRAYAGMGFRVSGECNLYGENWWCYEKELEEE